VRSEQLVDDPAASSLSSVDDVYNHAVAAYALSAAWELGLLTRLGSGSGAMSLEAFASDNDLHTPSVREIARALALVQVLELSDDGATATAGRLFDDAMSKKGFFYWLTRGCGELFATMPQIVRNASRTGAFIKRDYRAVGIASREVGSPVDQPFYDLVAGRGFRYGADLGCGSAERLIRLAQQDPGFHGIGIDVAAGAVALAREVVVEASLDSRITVIRDDVTRLRYRPEFREVDVVSCFMMGHDLWPRSACVASLRAIGEAFPAARDLIMCDTYRSDLLSTERHPIFTLGFEAAHAVMGQMLPSLEEWTDMFEETGWKMATLMEFELPPYTALMHLTRSQV
jgi:SAM-dependent methyltransferase